jgi:hypothetical protein
MGLNLQTVTLTFSLARSGDGGKTAPMALRILILVLWLASLGAQAEDKLWKAGVAKTDITPSEALWMAGYAIRDKPAEGKLMSLWVKVLALEDGEGHRAIILTSDTLGIPQSIYRNVSKGLREKFGLKLEAIILSASHTHCGPVAAQRFI